MIAIILYGILGLFVLTSIIFVIRYKLLKRRALDKLKFIPNGSEEKWTSEFLDAKRRQTDNLADETVREIMSNKELIKVNHLFEMITKDSDKIPDDAPIEIKEYFAKSAVLPDWADQDLIDLGQQIYIRHGIWISILLSFKSLPECYACAHGAEVLHKTARLNEQHGSMETFSRRIAETALFVMEAMTPGGLKHRGSGMVAAQKVRLIHAVIRHYLREKNWDSEQYGEPINQEDMAGTLMSFSSLIIEGLETIGIELEPVEKEAYIHCWRVIGHIIGLDDDIIPQNSEDALTLGYAILDHQKGKSVQSTELMHALLVYQNTSSKMMSPENNVAMFRMMMGEEISDMLDVPQAEEGRVEKLKRKIKRMTWVMEKLDHSLVFAMVLQVFTKVTSMYLVKRMTKSNIITFYLPKSLKMDFNFKPAKIKN